MIGVIGGKRLIILAILILINAGLGALTYAYYMPEHEKTERSLRSLRGQLSTVQNDISRMQIEFEQLDQQQDEFDALKAEGFFSNQVRSTAKALFSEIQDESKVISAVVSVKSGVIEESPEAQKAKHKVLMSLVNVDLKAFDDGDVYTYLDLMQKKFPGHVSVDRMIINRTRDVSAPVLRAIASGANPELVNASLSLSWRTLIPEDQVIDNTDKQ